jgi:hypothetical protein
MKNSMYNKIISSLRKLFAKKFLWYLVPSAFLTVSFQTLSFIFVSYNELYYLEHSQFREI